MHLDGASMEAISRAEGGGEDGDAALRTGLLLKAALGWLRVRAPTECAASRS